MINTLLSDVESFSIIFFTFIIDGLFPISSKEWNNLFSIISFSFLSDADSKNITLVLSKEYNDKSIIEKIGGVVDKDGNISINYNPKQETSRDILKKAEEAGLEVNDFSVTGASLETVFLSMTSKK